jgi:hypothetical protein
VVAAFTFAFAANKAPEQPIVIDSKDVFTAKKQGPVTFNHAAHKESKCTQCHHEFQDGKNVWQEGQDVKKCGACHKLAEEGKMLKLEKAAHNQCLECHKKLKAENKKTGPVVCAKCHAKKEGAAPAAQ